MTFPGKNDRAKSKPRSSAKNRSKPFAKPPAQPTCFSLHDDSSVLTHVIDLGASSFRADHGGDNMADCDLIYRRPPRRKQDRRSNTLPLDWQGLGLGVQSSCVCGVFRLVQGRYQILVRLRLTTRRQDKLPRTFPQPLRSRYKFARQNRRRSSRRQLSTPPSRILETCFLRLGQFAVRQ